MTKVVAKYPAHVDAHCPHHLTVDCGSPRYLPDGGSVGEEPQKDGDDGSDDEEEEVVDGKGESHDRHRALEDGGHGDCPVVGAPDELHEIGKDE